MERKDIQSIWAAYQEVQEKKLKGDQHKLDMDKDGDIDATDFKHMRDKKKVAKEEVELDEAVEFYVRLDHLDGDKRMEGAVDLLNKYVKSKKIDFESETDKGAYFYAKSKSDISKLDRELRKFATGAQMTESVELDEISKAKLRDYKMANEKDRERLSKDIGWIKNGKYTPKQKSLSKKLKSRNAMNTLASKKLYPSVWAKHGPAKIAATEQVENNESTDPRTKRGYQDPNDKGLSPGGKQMKADMQKGAKYDDTEEKGHQDAAKFGKKMKASPMRNNDNSQGDKNIIPSATKVKEAKTIDAFFRALIDKEGNA